MDGEGILRAIVQEQLRSVAGIPSTINRDAAGNSIYAFCLGAAVGLTKAGLLTAASQTEILGELAVELKSLGLVSIVKREMRNQIDLEVSAEDESNEEEEKE